MFAEEEQSWFLRVPPHCLRSAHPAVLFSAQSFPSKPIRIVVPTIAGSAP
jgi:hypothetical protein